MKEFPAAVPEVPVTDMNQALNYYHGKLGFSIDWGGANGGIASSIFEASQTAPRPNPKSHASRRPRRPPRSFWKQRTHRLRSHCTPQQRRATLKPWPIWAAI
jgi:hypothetical protein